MSIWKQRQARRQRRYENTEQMVADLDDHITAGLWRITRMLNRAARQADLEGLLIQRQLVERFVNEYPNLARIRNQAYAVFRPLESEPNEFPNQADMPDKNQFFEYKISWAKLAQAFAYLTQPLPRRAESTEWMVAVSGIQLDERTFTLEDLVPVAIDKQGVAGASFDMKAFRPITLTIYDHGLKLHAVFHSHPSHGLPRQSQTDGALQAQLESAGYPAIQAVFSQDGYVRFSATSDNSVSPYLEKECNMFRLARSSSYENSGTSRVRLPQTMEPEAQTPSVRYLTRFPVQTEQDANDLYSRFA